MPRRSPASRRSKPRAKEYADRIVAAWQEVPRRLNATNDFFIRTTDEGHKAFVQDFLQRMYDAGDVYEDIYAGFYCVGCEAFKTPDELVDGKCPLHDTEPEWIEEKNWFFRLSAYQDRLLELYDTRPDFVLPSFRYNEARSFIAGGLQDFSISRAGQPWGISIPWDPDQVAYVWADALVNYLSALTYAREGEDLRERFWPASRHLIGKDIIRFHCVFWPAMLMSAGYDVPHQVYVHGYLLLDDRKISKSLGNVVDPLDLIDVYGADAVRFWAARAVSFGQDGTVSIESVHERYERGSETTWETSCRVRRRWSIASSADPCRRSLATTRRSPGWSAGWETRSPGASTCSISRARWRRSGRSCAALTATSSRRRLGSSPRTGGRTSQGNALRPRRRTPCRRGSSRAIPSRDGSADPRHARIEHRAARLVGGRVWQDR